jgi:hypothetical protein
MTIDEKKFNRLWTIGRYIHGLYPIITNIVFFFIFHETILSSKFTISLSVIEILLGILILTCLPRIGAYIMAGLLTVTISVLIISSNVMLIPELNIFAIVTANFIVIYSYIMFGLLTKLKETTIH